MAKGYSARKGFSGGAGMMQQQAQMQQKLMKMQQEMSKASGKKELTALTIKPDVVDPEDVEMLQDLVISAVNEALRQAEEAMSSSMNALTGGLNIPGLGL